MGAACAGQDWWDRHFLPVFFLPHDKYVRGERLARGSQPLRWVSVLVLWVHPADDRPADPRKNGGA